MTATNPVLRAALAYRAAGFSVIPICRRRKRPLAARLPRIPDPERAGGSRATWKLFQYALASEGQLWRWFGDGKPNVAIVCGPVSGGLVVLDFDREVGRCWRAVNSAAGPLAEKLALARSGKGLHAYFRTARPGRNRVLAADEAGRVLVEARATGGLVTAPPSLHRSGRRYRWVRGGPDTVPALTAAAAELLLGAVRELDRRPAPSYRSVAIPENLPPVELDQAARGRLAAYARGALTRAAAELAAARGQRNNGLVRAAFQLGRYAGVGLLEEGEIAVALEAACGPEGNGLIPDDGWRAFRATLRSGLQAGAGRAHDLQELWWKLE